MHSSAISSTTRSNSQGEHSPFAKTISVQTFDDDKQSTISRDIPRAEHALEALQLVAGNRVRHARCAPEFLEEVAGAHLKKFTSKKFKIITGSEARSFFKNYIIEHNQNADNDNLTSNEDIPSPIVFAITVWEAGRKCVDYYMTWRGRVRPRHSKDFESRTARLDSDFRRLAKTLDREYKRISSLKKHLNVATSLRKVEKKTRFGLLHKSRSPSNISVPIPEQENSKLVQQNPESPVSATDSVMSLPLLNMVRGVPFSHRVPLRVTNPDRMSIISEIDVLVKGPTNTSQPLPSIAVEASPPVRDNSDTPRVSVEQRSSHKITDENIKNSSASIRSADTRSSRSSVSSRSSSNSEPEEKEKVVYEEDEPCEFLIVFLGDRLDRDPTSWHGLEKQSSIRRLPADRHSPWISPLARPDDSVHYQHRQSLVFDSDSDEDEGNWRNSPVVPMKPMMEAMGFIPNTAYFRPAPVIPSVQYHPSIMGSPAPHQSPYLYSSPQLDTPSYVAAWSPSLHIPPTASPLSRPLSQAYSATYASPYMQPHNSPF
ncbi:hypothetical protein BYT27DRAFT_7189962 [Phlegmacium glaucopus]|nr:hypothetical protein BYT27DRAFT_7189962 [Phlegmacium glaucopus]